MTESPNLRLPLLQAAQAQKHVTMNEALTRLDALAQLTIEAVDVVDPPLSPGEGEVWGIGQAATGDWQGQDGDLALWVNGGWVFVTPRRGWRGEIMSPGGQYIFDGFAWVPSVAHSIHGAATIMRVIEVDHTVVEGETSITEAAIPARGVVSAVTGRVVEPLTGSLETWQLGVPGAEDRYGAGIGPQMGSVVLGVTGAPVTYWEPTALVLRATGGTFGGGRVRLAVHVTEFAPPRA